MNTYQSITQDLKKLDAEQLDLVAEYVAMLLAGADTEDPEPEDPDGGDNGNKGPASSGWVELKTIRGYGPYAYLRWREGKRIRSKYLGKVKSAG
jgi:hypothetical protein